MRIYILFLALICGTYTYASNCKILKVKIPEKHLNCATPEDILFSKASIKVGSYNLYGIRKIKELKNDLKALSQVDVWSFQEVPFSSKYPLHIMDILPNGTWYIYSKALNTEKNMIEGQVLASRLPILNTLLIPLQASGKKRRAALGIQININHQRTWIFNTDHEVEVFKLGFEDRKKQLASLLDFTSRLHTPVVILGDFNTAGDQRPTKYLSSADEVQQTYQIMKDHGFTWPHSIPDNEFTFESFFANNFLDHIFLKDLKPQAWNKFSERQGSDHFPIWTLLEL